jgi:hypothetical protein
MAQSDYDRINGIWIHHLQTKYDWENTYGPIPHLETEPPSLQIFIPFTEIQKTNDADVIDEVYTFIRPIMKKFEETVSYKMHEFKLFCIEQDPFFEAVQLSNKGKKIIITNSDIIQASITEDDDFDLTYAWSKIQEELIKLNEDADVRGPMPVIPEFDAIFCINTHGCVLAGKSGKKGECVDDACRYKILKPPEGKRLTFLTATPLGVANMSHTGDGSIKELTELKKVIHKEIRKGHLDIHNLQQYLRTTKITDSLKYKDDPAYHSYLKKQGWNISHHYFERVLEPDSKFGIPIVMLYTSPDVSDRMKRAGITEETDLFTFMLGEPESGRSSRKERRKTYIMKSKFIKFIHRYCDNPLIIDTSCSSFIDDVDARELRLLQRRQKTKKVFGGNRKQTKVRPYL